MDHRSFQETFFSVFEVTAIFYVEVLHSLSANTIMGEPIIPFFGLCIHESTRHVLSFIQITREEKNSTLSCRGILIIPRLPPIGVVSNPGPRVVLLPLHGKVGGTGQLTGSA